MHIDHIPECNACVPPIWATGWSRWQCGEWCWLGQCQEEPVGSGSSWMAGWVGLCLLYSPASFET